MKLATEAFLRLIYPATCGVCQLPLALEEKGLCEDCQEHLHSVYYPSIQAIASHPFKWVDQAWNLAPYASPVKELLWSVKFARKRWLIENFEKGLEDVLGAILADNHYDALIAVPIEIHRLAERHFNQAELITELIEKKFGIPQEKILKKVRSARSQNKLSRDERRFNVRNTFRVRRHWKLEGLSFLIVDDILTTGATAEEMARMLKDKGAKRVDLFTLARTDPKNESVTLS